jgi:23S rRNA (cytosine1962-C5)-methyltransferase
MTQVVLKRGREKSALRRHPWVFSGAIDRVEGEPEAGETVAVRSATGEFLGWAAWSPQSQIRLRFWSWREDERVDRPFLEGRLLSALRLRQTLGLEEKTDAMRLVHAESDGIPGLIVDRYGDFLVVQFSTAGAVAWRSTVVDLLAQTLRPRGIFERADSEADALEGLPVNEATLWGEDPPDSLEVREAGLSFGVDLRNGQKTGFYLDQRNNRQRVQALAAGRRVLDGFCYTGGFTIAALAGGATEVLAVDGSTSALELGRQNVARNGLATDRVTWREADMFQELRRLRDRAESFDLIILDPPKFAPTAAQVQRAARGYKDINLLAFKLLRPGGILVTFSCSGGVSTELFQKIVADAALDAGVEGRITERLFQGPDHPVALNFPEGAYLKGLVVQVEK